MNDNQNSAPASNKAGSLIQHLTAFALIAFCWCFPHFGGMPMFIYPIIVLVVILAYLRWVTGERFTDLLFEWKRFTLKALFIGACCAVVLSLFFKFAWEPFFHSILPGSRYDLSDFAYIRHHLVNYLITLLLGIVVGGFYEELVFHGLIYTRLEKLLGAGAGKSFAFIITGILFGLYHFQQGIFGVFLAGIAGMVYHALSLRFNRNLWFGICCHACFDIIGLTLIFMGLV